MIYIDTSVVLAQLLAEDRRPRTELWSQALVTSRLLEYELWTRIHARGLAATHGDAARLVLARLTFIELATLVLQRASDPFPVPVRTLGALHLATMMFLREQGHDIALATFDARMRAAAEAMDLAVYEV